MENHKKDTHGAALGFSELVRLSGLGPRQVSDLIWEGVWKGQLSNDTFMALRKGIETRYKVNAAGAGMQRAQQSRARGRRYPLSRTGFSRYRGSLPLAGRCRPKHLSRWKPSCQLQLFGFGRDSLKRFF